jgi:hypothetical protein
MKAVALLWHRTLVVSAGSVATTHLIPADVDLGSALLAALAALPSSPQTVRLIYQPQDLLMQAVETPMGSRRSIRKALSSDYPAIANDLVLWGCQRLEPAGKKGAITLLCMEKSPRLRTLLADLSAANVQIDGVFPLLTLLERTPAAFAPGRSVAIAHTDSQALLYSRDEDAVRSTAAFYDDAEALALDYFSGTSIVPSGPQPTTDIVHLTPAPWAFATYLAGATPGIHPLEKFLAEALRIPSNDLSNFAPPSALPSLSTLSLAAGFVLFAAGAYLATAHEFTVRKLAADLANKQAQQRQLQTELNARQQRDETIKKAASFAADVGATPTGLSALLRALETDLPREVTVTGLRVTERDFTLEITTHVPSEKSGPFFAFFDALSHKDNPWKITTARPVISISAGTFSLNGILQ